MEMCGMEETNIMSHQSRIKQGILHNGTNIDILCIAREYFIFDGFWFPNRFVEVLEWIWISVNFPRFLASSYLRHEVLHLLGISYVHENKCIYRLLLVVCVAK